MLVKRNSFFDEDASAEKSVPAAEFSPANAVAGGCAVYNDNLSAQIDCLREMCSELNDSALDAALAEAEKYMNRESFRAAVVGLETIGKNEFINELLGKNVFGLDDEEYRRLFGAVPTVIAPGAEGIVLHSGKQPQKSERFPLNAEGWKKAAEFAVKNRSREVTVTVSGTFLDGYGAELVRGDLDSDLGSCDCAIVVMSAIQLLGEREMLAISEFSDSAPFSAAAVKHMDKLNETERGQICGYAAKKIGAAAPDTVLFVNGNITESVRGFIRDCRGSDRLCTLKAECISNSLARIGGRMTEIYSEQLKAVEERVRHAAADAEKRRSAMLESTKEIWDKIETQMLIKCASRFEWVEQKVAETRDDLIERFQFEIEHTSNPKDWLENTYPYRMKQEMKSLTKSLQMNLDAAYSNDLEWLNRQVKANFGADIDKNYTSVTNGVSGTTVEYSEVGTLSDMKKSRLIARGATGAATIIGYIALAPLRLSPVGMGISIGGGIIADMVIGKKIDKQRKELVEKLGQYLPAEFDRRLESVEKNLRMLYDNAVISAREAYADALENQAAKIDEQTAAKSGSEMGKVYNSRIEQLKQLKTED